VVAAAALVVAEFSLVSYRTIGIGACEDRVGIDKCRTIGHDAHAYALLVLAVVGLVMAWGAVAGRSRAASWATAAVGIGVLVIALAIDLPSLDDKRGLEQLYNDVGTHVGNAFRFEILGGVLLLMIGGLAVGRLGEEDDEPVAAPPEGTAPPPPPPGEDETVAEPEAYRPASSPETTADEERQRRAQERERSRRRRRKSGDG
jgi:hypothetical protein